MPTTFHGPTIDYHDLKMIDNTNITIGFLDNATMNKIVGATTVNQDDDLPILNIANELESLESREASESMQGNEWFNFGWPNGLRGSIGKGGLFNKWNCHIFFGNIFENGHNFIFFLTPVSQKIFFITIIAKTLQLAFNHFSPSSFLDLEGSDRGVRISGSRARNKRGFFFFFWEKQLVGLV
jgi:hypothetical protein